MNDEQMMELEQAICNLECDLRESDYEVIKAYEYSVCGIKAPYDMTEIHKERQAKRDRINEIQALLAKDGEKNEFRNKNS